MSFADYKINVEQAKGAIASAPDMSEYAEGRLNELTDKLRELTEDICLTAEDLIRVLAVHSMCCLAVTEQALVFVEEDGDLPKFGG